MLVKMSHASLGGLLASMAVKAADVCADPKGMDSAQQKLRVSLHYVEHASDQSKTCSACSFFQSTDQTCGMCLLFNAPANETGHCDSWSAKA
jgi:hypothetical protein